MHAKRILTVAACVSFIVGGFVYFYMSDPFRNTVTPPCVLHEKTGLYCAGCGGTRAAYLILHGDFLLSLRYNCLCIFALCGIMYYLVYISLRRTRIAIPSIQPGFKSVIVIMCALVIFTVLRNIPVCPLTLLAPPDAPLKAYNNAEIEE